MEAAAIVTLIAALYASSWWLHPLRACPSCKGTPRQYGGLHRTKFRWCSRCEGRGRVPRLGAVVLTKMGRNEGPGAGRGLWLVPEKPPRVA